MFKTLIILYALSFWVNERTPNPGRSFPYSPLSMLSKGKRVLSKAAGDFDWGLLRKTRDVVGCMRGTRSVFGKIQDFVDYQPLERSLISMIKRSPQAGNF